MKFLFSFTVLILMLFSQSSKANEYACKLGNSAVGNLLGKFKDRAMESCVDKCNYDFEGRFQERFASLQKLTQDLEKLYNPKANSSLENKSAKQILDKVTSIKNEIQIHQNKCLQKRREGLNDSATLECLNKYKDISSKIVLIDNAWDKYKNARASVEIYRRYNSMGVGGKIACTIILMGLRDEADDILGSGPYNEDKKRALLSLISRETESNPPVLQPNDDIPICQAFNAGKALLGNQNEVLQNCI